MFKMEGGGVRIGNIIMWDKGVDYCHSGDELFKFTYWGGFHFMSQLNRIKTLFWKILLKKNSNNQTRIKRFFILQKVVGVRHTFISETLGKIYICVC